MFDIGMVGLSVMGRSLALNMADHGFRVAGYNRSRAVTEQVAREHPHENFAPFYSLEELAASLSRPRRVMLMIQAGAAVDAVLEQLIPLLDEGDIVLDGGNSFFEDTRRRHDLLAEHDLLYFGVGISGGEEGARRGPSIMPGGDPDAYESIRPILEAVAAKAGGEPCCTYIGPDGAGHYVKMVHNGIEYADMQLIAESYLLLKYIGGYSNEELSALFAEWNEGELQSYLIGITADIFREPDDLAPGSLLDRIVDSAAQKGTGRWTSIESLRQGVDVSMITAAAGARVLSNQLERREKAGKAIPGPAPVPASDRKAFAEQVREGLYTAKIVAYAQGFSLLRDASSRYGWALDLGAIASIFRAGCIIQAAFLNDITAAFTRDPALESLLFDGFFRDRIVRGQDSLRRIAAAGIAGGLPLPAMTNALSYLDAFRSPHVGANLIQAQRDCFGAHTYLRTDRKGIFHHEWGQKSW
ncbi:NADP-dependent phosphogluconate dehydrogenase [Agathobaculum sp.]|uniref:NADP-dependent phosphogluconate dehydrogenase n=1 Tax=Agathobaculum sp. TaxID=2048138 RepID=UPI002A817FBF|nr:NADP-dependent phosphogluconate dehydrogenase [Agathobaculum sp.]MDY3618363.1 NADP-dependent phosphogluconate dehydrogenase [Agathobaculum sp.]